MKIHAADRGLKKRGAPRAVESVRGEQEQAAEFDPKEFLSGRARHYLDNLIHKHNLQENDLGVLIQSWWISALDEGYLQDLAQADGLEEYIWSEIQRFRAMRLEPFNEPVALEQLSSGDVTQVSFTYLDAIKLKSIFPDSDHVKDILRLFNREKKVFLRLLEAADASLPQKLMVLFVLVSFLPEQKVQLLKKVSTEEIRQEVKKTQDLDWLLPTVVLFPELRLDVEAAFERLKPKVEASLRELKKMRYNSTSEFRNYLLEVIPYFALTAQELNMRPNGTLDIRLQPELSSSKPPLPERPSV